MKEQVLKTISRHNMIIPGSRVLVAVSGGADSMCLLSVMKELTGVLNIKIAAAHVNHCIRGAEADNDEMYVQNYCEMNNISFYSKKINIPEIAEKTNESTELCARRERYAYLNSLGFDVIATAHTGSDTVETMLMNLSRGASLKGLCGIPPVRDNIIRPLIELTRADTERYCTEHDIKYVTDSTNLEDIYTRNKFRHNVIETLKDINPSFVDNALRCISTIKRDEDFISEYAEKKFKEAIIDNKYLDVEKIACLNDAVSSRVIAKFLSLYTSSDFENKHIEYIISRIKEKFAVNIPGNIIICGDGRKIFIRNDTKNVEAVREVIINKYEGGKIFFGKYEIEVFRSLKTDKLNNCMIIDFSKIDDIIIIRSRLSGDNITLPKRRCSKSLKKYYNEIGIPQEERVFVPVIADKNGVIGVCGYSADEARIPDKDSKEYLIIRMKGGTNE